MPTLPHLPHLHVALLAGGRGTRAWPLSRRKRPKQLVDLAGEGPLLVATRDRVAALCPPERLLAVTAADLAPAIRRLLGVPAANVLVEPEGRGTAAAVGMALLVAAVRDPRAVVLALPADHHVRRPAALRATLAAGVRAAARLRGTVLFGAVPDRPAIEYGYLVPGEAVPGGRDGGPHRVARFAEKPTATKARRLIGSGALWNSGMFALHAASCLEEIGTLLPELGAALAELRPHVDRPSFRRVAARLWPTLPAVSFDVGVLERSDRVHALALDVGWSDVGSWLALGALSAADAKGNRARSGALFHEASDCLVLGLPDSRRRPIVLAGVSHLAVVDAGDVVLVCPRSGVPKIDALLARLARERPELA
jgi:mannose-1-phosphate guanylyltransferase